MLLGNADLFFFFSVTPSEPLNVKALINRLIKWTSPVLAKPSDGQCASVCGNAELTQ